MPRVHPFRNARADRVGLAVLLVLMVLAQTLGWMHRSVHGPAVAVRTLAQVAVASAPAPADGSRMASPGHTWLHALFGDHADPTDCRLFDLIAQPGCVPAAAVAVSPPPLSNAFLAAGHADFVARWSALFDARGPPGAR